MLLPLIPQRRVLHRLISVDGDREVVVVVVLGATATVSMAEQTAHVRHPWREHCSRPMLRLLH